jgi:hypothetical protein
VKRQNLSDVKGERGLLKALFCCWGTRDVFGFPLALSVYRPKKMSQSGSIKSVHSEGDWYEAKLLASFDEGFARTSRREAMQIAIHKARILVAKWMNRPILRRDAFPRSLIRRYQSDISRYQMQFAQRTKYVAELTREMARYKIPNDGEKEKEYVKLQSQYTLEQKYLKEIESCLVKLGAYENAFLQWIHQLRAFSATLTAAPYVEFLMDILESNSHTAKYGASVGDGKLPKVPDIGMDMIYITACRVEDAIPILINFAHNTIDTVLGPKSFDRFPDPSWLSEQLPGEIVPLELDSSAPDIYYYPYGLNALNQIRRDYAPDILFKMLQEVPRKSEQTSEAAGGRMNDIVVESSHATSVVFDHHPQSAGALHSAASKTVAKAEAHVAINSSTNASLAPRMQDAKAVAHRSVSIKDTSHGPVTKVSASPFLTPNAIGTHMSAAATAAHIGSSQRPSTTSYISHMQPSQYTIPHL